MRRAAVGLVLALVACGPSGSATVGDSSYDFAASGTPEGLPDNAPALFGFGSEAAAARVAMWDIDVKPDGEGLPPGAGTVAEGQKVFETYCVSCHGATGTEGPNDRLVGTEPWGEWPGSMTVGAYWPYATTLFDYIRKAMPQSSPGVLSGDQIYAVIAYILRLNQIVPEDAVMNSETLPAVRMPARDRFVADDRHGGPEVR
jgi:S-disulfanyl-L-cysteine oxidoreductase SoxD